MYGLNRYKVIGESLIVFGGAYFYQCAYDIHEYSWRTFDKRLKSHIVFGGVNFHFFDEL